MQKEGMDEIDSNNEETNVQFEQAPFFQSKTLRTIIYVVGAMLLLLVVFKAGEMVESQRADFAYRWSQNYYPNFVGEPYSRMGFGGNDFMTAHGVFGPIISIDAPSLVVQDANSNVEKDVITSTRTSIVEFNSSIPFSNLGVNEQVIVIGSPDSSGQIQARLIRVIPAPSSLPLSAGGGQIQIQSQ